MTEKVEWFQGGVADGCGFKVALRNEGSGFRVALRRCGWWVWPYLPRYLMML